MFPSIISIVVACAIGFVAWIPCSFGEPESDMVEKPSPWSMAVDYFHYEFKGRKPADTKLNGVDIYSFEAVSLDLTLLTLKYTMSPLTSFSLIASHVNNYAETNFSGTLYKDRAQGTGDTIFKGTRLFLLSAKDLLILEVGISLPTGSIDRKNASNQIYNYPYNMQLGTGTYDPIFSSVYIHTIEKHQLGSYGLIKIRPGRNTNGYRFGNEYHLGGFYSYNYSPFFIPSLKVNYKYLQRIEGQDNTFGRSIYTEFYHNKRDFWDVTLGLTSNYAVHSKLNLKADFGLPVWQGSKNIDNVQVDLKWYLQLGAALNF